MGKVGHKHSDESLEKMRQSAKRRKPVSDDTRQKLAEKGRGRPVSEATREKLRIAAINRNADARQHISKAAKRRWDAYHLAHPVRLKHALPPLGEGLRGALKANPLYAAAAAVVTEHDPAIRDDIIGDLVLAVLAGEVVISDVAQAAMRITRRHWRMFRSFDTIPIETIQDYLADNRIAA